jgi:hypothetical protein
MKHSWTKDAFRDLNNKKWRKWCKFVSPYYLITIMAYLCLQWTSNVQIKYFMFDWSIYRLYALISGWKLVCLQRNIFVYFCSTWGIVELKTRFGTWKARKEVNGVCLFRLPYLITLMASLCSQRTPNVQVLYFIFDSSIYILVEVNSSWKLDSLQMMIFVNVCWTWRLVELKTSFKTWITRNDVNCVFVSPSLFNKTYGIPVLTMDTKCQNQVFYVWFVLNRGWKLDPLQIMIFVYVSSTWNIFELNAFWVVNIKKWRKWCKFFSPFLINKCFGLRVLTIGSSCPNQLFFVWLDDLRAICAK